MSTIHLQDWRQEAQPLGADRTRAGQSAQPSAVARELRFSWTNESAKQGGTTMFERTNWIWLLIAVLLLALVLAVPVGGRKDNPRTAAPTEKNYAGTIEAVKLHTCEICSKVELSVILIPALGGWKSDSDRKRSSKSTISASYLETLSK
jgi:hypothetical protein